jgi:ribosomal protein S18 acetylase RimI-like enzyme
MSPQSYLEPERGTALLRWLAATIEDATAVLYDPIALNDVFGATLQHYFAVKGCELRSLREFQTANDHFRRLLVRANWRTCSIMDMNQVYARFTTSEDKKRLAMLEPFDEHADWWLCNAHYAIFVATNRSKSGLQTFGDTAGVLTATNFPSRGGLSPVIVRTFQSQDLARVQDLFQATHLDFAKTSKAVRKFVEKRLQSPDGDMFDVGRSLQCARSGFWVAEVDVKVVGCIGVKPTGNDNASETNGSMAELCRLSVDASFRRRGVASALIATLEEFVVDHDYKTVCLETIGTMSAAQHLYRAHGFMETTSSKFSSFSLVRFEKVLVQ